MGSVMLGDCFAVSGGIKCIKGMMKSEGIFGSYFLTLCEEKRDLS